MLLEIGGNSGLMQPPHFIPKIDRFRSNCVKSECTAFADKISTPAVTAKDRPFLVYVVRCLNIAIVTKPLGGSNVNEEM